MNRFQEYILQGRTKISATDCRRGRELDKKPLSSSRVLSTTNYSSSKRNSNHLVFRKELAYCLRRKVCEALGTGYAVFHMTIVIWKTAYVGPSKRAL